MVVRLGLIGEYAILIFSIACYLDFMVFEAKYTFMF